MEDKGFISLALHGLFKRENFLILATFFLGMIFLSIGVIQLLGNREPAIKVENAEDVKGVTDNSKVSAKIKVDVEGAVMNPGVYDLKSDARFKDALASAGGLSEEADREYVAKGLNLAQKLIDGVKIYIPRVNEKVTNVSSSVSTSTGDGTSAVSGSINVNTASQDSLESLPGVGPVTAGKIINGRPYSDINELLSKKVVGSSVFGKIKDQISTF